MNILKSIFWNGYESRFRAGLRIIFSMVLLFLLYRRYLLVWTSGSFGPEAGLLGLYANIVGKVLIFVWVSIKQRKKIGDIQFDLAK